MVKARQIGGHSLADCQRMHEILDGHKHLPKPVTIKENGVKITICPPARASGIWAKLKY